MTARDLCSMRRATIDVLEDRKMLAVTEFITNGNFALNGSGWNLTGDFKADATYTNAYSSPGYAYLAASDGNLSSSNNLDGTISQNVTIPANATSATFSYWFKTTTEETGGSNDTVQVRVKNPTTGATLATLSTIYNTTMSAYQLNSGTSLLAYAGQTISISFDGHTNETNGTVFRVDNVSLMVDVPAPPPTPSSLPAPIAVGPGTTTPSGLPTLNTPVPTVRWNLIPGAVGYGVILQKLSGTTYSTVYDSETSTFPTPIKGTTFSPSTGMTAGTYRWQVRGIDASGFKTAYSPALYFTLATTGYNRATGIDISHYQTVSSWASVKTNGTSTITTDDISFVYTKATEGVTYKDPKFASFVSGAASVGLPIGGYHFPHPGTNSAVAEATEFYNTIKTSLIAGNLIPMLDFEDNSASTVALGKTALSKWLNDFGDKLYELSGQIMTVYSGISYASSYLNSSVIRYPLWRVAYDDVTMATPISPTQQPSNVSPYGSNGWSIWQYTDQRPVAGISSGVDGDVANADVATFLEAFKIAPTTTYTITGTLFEDANGNGTKDTGEAGINGRTVFIDADGDGVLDAGEKTTTTNASGIYSFASMLQGNYIVRQIVPTTSAATGAVLQSFKLAVGIANPARDFGSKVIDSTPPTIATNAFAFESPARPINIVFSEDVGTTLTNADAVLTNTTTGATFATTLIYTAATKTAVFTPVDGLTNGDYTLVIAAGNVADAAGNTNAAMSVAFFNLNGDINRDRNVNFDDLIALAQNYNQSGVTFAQGDLTNDGTVNFDDLIVLAQNYGSTLAATQLIAAQSSSAASVAVAGSSTTTTTKSPATKKKPSSDVLA